MTNTEERTDIKKKSRVYVTASTFTLLSKRIDILQNRYRGEELLRFRADVRNSKRIRKESPKYFLGSVYPYETLEVLPLGTGPVIYLFF